MWAALILMAIVGELIDSSLGMMYGTLLTPLLIGLGYAPKVVVPSILLSQATGGLVATFGHHKYKNGDFKGWTHSTKIAVTVIVPGLLACVLGAFVAVSISSFALSLYIGILVIIMGLLCISRLTYKFNWYTIGVVGLLSGFNKALSGGGFGPVTSTGKVLAGVDTKVSVATTTYAEVPICLASFFAWWLLGNPVDWVFTSYLVIGSIGGALFGPCITAKINSKWLRPIVGCLAVASGILVLVKLFL